jgi:hypothetical protein
VIHETVTKSVSCLHKRRPSVLPDDSVDLDPPTLLKLADSPLSRVVELVTVARHTGLCESLMKVAHGGPVVASFEW